MTRTLTEIEADIVEVRRAIGTGARRVRYRDGREVEYRDQASLERAVAFLEEERQTALGTEQATRVVGRYVSGFSS